jgi:hypothetical protein
LSKDQSLTTSGAVAVLLVVLGIPGGNPHESVVTVPDVSVAGFDATVKENVLVAPDTAAVTINVPLKFVVPPIVICVFGATYKT